MGRRAALSRDHKIARAVAKAEAKAEAARLAVIGFVKTPDGKLVRADSPTGRAIAPNAPAPSTSRAEDRRRYARVDRACRRLRQIRQIRTKRERFRARSLTRRRAVRLALRSRASTSARSRAPRRRVPRDDGSGDDDVPPPSGSVASSHAGGRHA